MREASQTANRCELRGCENDAEGKKYCVLHREVQVPRATLERLVGMARNFTVWEGATSAGVQRLRHAANDPAFAGL